LSQGWGHGGQGPWPEPTQHWGWARAALGGRGRAHPACAPAQKQLGTFRGIGQNGCGGTPHAPGDGPGRVGLCWAGQGRCRARTIPEQDVCQTQRGSVVVLTVFPLRPRFQATPKTAQSVFACGTVW